jgi:hypothetical protein
MILTIQEAAKIGIVTDQLAMQLPPEAWTAGQNVRFSDNKVSKSKGWEVFEDPGLDWDGTDEQVYFVIPYNDGTTASEMAHL